MQNKNAHSKTNKNITGIYTQKTPSCNTCVSIINIKDQTPDKAVRL